MFSLDFNLNFSGNKKSKIVVPDYLEFVKNAGYPIPYKKQIEAYKFIFEKPWKTQVKMVLGHRGSGKTDYLTVLGTSHQIAKNPNYRAMITTKERVRGGELISAGRDALSRNNIKILNRSRSSVRVRGLIGKDPNLISIPIRGRGARGRHPDIVELDDPVTPDDVSPATRRHAKIFYEEALKLSPKVAIYGQPVHKLDLYQELRGLVEVFEIVHGDIPELMADLDAQRAAGVSERSIQASYFLKIEDDLTMPFLKMPICDFFPGGSSVAFIDPAAKGGNGRDFTAIAIGRLHFDQFICAGFAFPKAWEDCLDEMKFLFEMFKTSRLFFEDNIAGTEPVKRLNQMGMPTKGHTATGNKHGRIMRMALHRENIKLTKVSGMTQDMQKANEIFIQLVREYEYNSEHDDPPDALSSLLEKVGLIHG